MVEVLIAGAGPAGCVAATLLARLGIRVLLVDRARFPRDKLCGDTVNPGTVADLARFGLGAGALGSGLAIDGMVLTGERGVRVIGRYAAGQQGRALTRRDLDSALLDGAVAAGAQFEERVAVREALMDSTRRGMQVRGATVRTASGASIRIPACVTIAADGRRSTLAFGLGLARHPRTPRRRAVGAYFGNVEGLTSFGEMHVRSGRYIGVAPLPRGIANVCLVTSDRAALRRPEEALMRAIREDYLLKDRFSAATAMGPVAVLGPLAVETRTAGMSGLLLAGDAGGFIDPMTGDGLRFAVRGAEMAAEVALQMLQDGSADGFRELQRRRATEFRRKWQFNRALRRLVSSGVGVQAAALSARLMPGAFRRMIAIAGDAA